MVDADVVVIGAGLAGLQTARRLVAADLDVVVLEARDRVGGRIDTRRLSGAGDAVVDLGGRWLGGIQDRMYALVEELGLETYPSDDRGEHLLVLGGARTQVGARTRLAAGRSALPRRVSPFVLADLVQAHVRFDRLARSVPLDGPWDAPAARSLDSRTFESWIRSNLRSAAGRAFFRVVAEAMFATQSSDVSLLHALFHVHSGPDLDTLLTVDGDGRRDRVVGGAGRITDAMASVLGARVRLGAPVRRIVHRDDAVVVEVEGDREALSARRVVITLPPTLAGRLVYDPALPSWRDQLMQRVPSGSSITTFGVYDEPFWREDGLTGRVISDEGPVKMISDASPPNGAPGILLGTLTGAEARWLGRVSPGERRAAVTASFARYLGPRAASPHEYLERDWSAEPYARGSGGYLGPGVWTGFGPALRAPIGPIHWAGAETAVVWNGHMEGAVGSGDRAAAEVLAALR